MLLLRQQQATRISRRLKSFLIRLQSSVMARAKKSSDASYATAAAGLRRSTRNIKIANEAEPIVKQEAVVVEKPTTSRPRNNQTKGAGKRASGSLGRDTTPEELDGQRQRRHKRVKTEDKTTTESVSPARSAKQRSLSATPPKSETDGSPRKKSTKAKTAEDKVADLQAKKLKSYAQFAGQSPFPDFAHPTPAECKLAHQILISLHGERVRPESLTAAPAQRAGCGDSPSVLDALVRTILSQNTSDKNSTRAKLNMDAVYGGSDKWEAIVAGGQAKLQKAIESGGLSVVKSKAIIRILEQAHERYGTYSLDHLFRASDEDAMREMLSFQGVGPKTASCVLLFCLRRESFAVDTHVHRIAGLLGWRPRDCTRDQAHAHLDARVPDEDKYGLHVLLIKHGKTCEECRAGGKNLGKCELRRAFRRGKVEGLAGEEVKEEEEEEKKIKKEEEEEE
ncbi:base excision DNA repair protein [Biscogniauxia sp. FL1348]|nr:base excision DNA repair protein [Biscogniauxia sp. FL1348]